MNKISICIPTYNQALYLEQAVRSAAEQTHPPVEIIVADDCSTDNTPEVLQKLSAEIPTLKVIRQTQNTGIAFNTNTCLSLATGDFVVRLDSDDYLSSDYVKKLAELLVAHPKAGYAHAAVQEIDHNGKLLKKRKLNRESGFQSGNEALRAVKKGYKVAANIIMFRRSALVSVNYAIGRPNYVEDYHMSASLAATGFGNVYLDEILSFYRVWLDAGKVRQRRKLLEISGVRKVFEEIIEPAYMERGWGVGELKRRRTNLACRQSDCLGWSIYSADEKTELAEELKRLSPSRRASLVAWLYQSRVSIIATSFLKVTSIPKAFIKFFYLRFRF